MMIEKIFFASLMLGSLALLMPLTSTATTITGSSGFIFDPADGNSGGAMDNGSIDAYDGAYYLAVNGTQFGGTGTLSADGRTVNYPGVQFLSNLTVSRALYVPAKDKSPSADYGRYLDCIKNTGKTAVENIDVMISGNLGSDSNTVLYNSSNGDAIWQASDSWAGTDDSDASGDPSLAHVVGKKVLNPTLSADAMVWHFTIPLLDAKSTTCFATFAVQANNRAGAKNLANSLAKNPDLSDLSAGVQGTIANFANVAEIAVFPATGKVLETSNFDADIVLTGSDKALTGGVLSIQLNDADISASCSQQQALMNIDETATLGRVVHCPAISALLLKPGANRLVATHTTAGGQKAVARINWPTYPSQPLP